MVVRFSRFTVLVYLFSKLFFFFFSLRIFIHDNDSNSDVNENVDANDGEALMRAIGGHNLSPPSSTPMMASSEVVEIILLDVYGNQHVRLVYGTFFDIKNMNIIIIGFLNTFLLK